MPKRTPSPSVDAFVEIPKGSRARYELDKDTIAGDGDPLDALVIVEEPTFPGWHRARRPIGTPRTRDENGPGQTFFATYKALEGEAVELTGWRGAETAWRLIAQSREPSKAKAAH